MLGVVRIQGEHQRAQAAPEQDGAAPVDRRTRRDFRPDAASSRHQPGAAEQGKRYVEPEDKTPAAEACGRCVERRAVYGTQHASRSRRVAAASLAGIQDAGSVLGPVYGATLNAAAASLGGWRFVFWQARHG